MQSQIQMAPSCQMTAIGIAISLALAMLRSRQRFSFSTRLWILLYQPYLHPALSGASWASAAYLHRFHQSLTPRGRDARREFSRATRIFFALRCRQIEDRPTKLAKYSSIHRSIEQILTIQRMAGFMSVFNIEWLSAALPAHEIIQLTKTPGWQELFSVRCRGESRACDQCCGSCLDDRIA